MKIIEPYFIIESQLKADELIKQVEKAGRTAYKSEDMITPDSAKEFVSMINQRGHHSVIEHQSITVRVICDRGVSHEIVRHRLASYTQESTRYCNYTQGKFGNEITVIKPCFWKENDEKYLVWKEALSHIEKAYNKLIGLGATPQEARSVLPNSLKTEIVMTMNLREWKHFFRLRTSEAAHPQMREIAIPLLKEFQKLVPIIFDDLREILVVKRDLLFSKKHFIGFIEQSEVNFEKIILENYRWMMQGDAEKNGFYKQPIGYVIIYNPKHNKIFVYQRSDNSANYKEKKLQGKYSCGVGGHIERADATNSNPITESILREVREEIEIKVLENIKTIGYINNEDDVGLVHFGILYIVETNLESLKPKAPEITSGRFVEIKEFEDICNNPDYNVEEWSKIALNPLNSTLRS